jgi:hypothetical protein
MQAASTPRTDISSETESSRRAKCRACGCRDRSSRPQRKGFAALDYALVLGVIFPVAAALLWMGPKIMMLVYEMTAVIISWPFM